MDLNGSSAIVTGASMGIGLAITEALIAKGSRVAGFARGEERLNELGERHGDSFIPLACDIRDLESVRRAVHQAKERLERLDILINNAGIGRFGPVDELSKEDWDGMMSTNVSGTYHCIREVVPVMKERESGHIVNLASIAGLVGNPNLSGYNASKYAVRGLSDALFKELRSFGIKVTAIYPGSTATTFSTGGRPSTTTNKMDPSEVADVVLYVLERSENFLVSEVVLRPLKVK